MSLYYQDEYVTLYHGDCLKNHEWLHADILITDPPYGMSYVSGWTDARPITGDTTTYVRDEALRLWGQKPAIVFGTWRVTRPAATRQLIIWHKKSIGPGMGDLSLPWGNAIEEMYVIGDGWKGARRQNIITTNEQRGSLVGASALIGHPTPKPVGLLEQLIECAPTGTICDPFAGGGSTLIAARNLGHKAIGVEIDENYCQIIANRLAQGVLL
jgi:DNA modification methylase